LKNRYFAINKNITSQFKYSTRGLGKEREGGKKGRDTESVR